MPKEQPPILRNSLHPGLRFKDMMQTTDLREEKYNTEMRWLNQVEYLKPVNLNDINILSCLNYFKITASSLSLRMIPIYAYCSIFALAVFRDL